ncbi:limonene-1,2-epoxide hydrolase family protein [Rhodococcus tibetensis]|uniref:Nuclear transport factor 2 family protein n=1 Tax=Rhodococcus tibetensis TaxID=2965064 RepID=A0ABT1QJR6_9NOCA|nr:limonene-1,2-epoxide hydrolase family protein [Rhodococcus sp. FXJ9.536]MCQ4122402.1 nuclear transport factor 2 family protein [Rhodococcus sp. FXJ9.536]
MEPRTHPTETALLSDTANVQLVRRFLAALASGDPDSARQYLHPDIVWHNVSLPKVRGIDSVMRILRGSSRPGVGFDVRLHHIADEGTAVLTERTDILIWKRVRSEFWVCGTFEIEDGKILVWRDYFSNRDVLWGTIKGIVRAF